MNEEQQKLIDEYTDKIKAYEFRDRVIPYHMHNGLALYLALGIQPGGFLRAVLSGDLFEAVGQADMGNIHAIPVYAAFLYNQVPAQCFGNREAVSAWIAAGGQYGLYETAKKQTELFEDGE